MFHLDMRLATWVLYRESTEAGKTFSTIAVSLKGNKILASDCIADACKAVPFQ